MSELGAENFNQEKMDVTEELAETTYRRSRSQFYRSAERAKTISRGTGGIRSPSSRHYWASVLFTRLTVTSQSIIHLCPKTAPIADRSMHWDFSAVASITRSLCECYFVFYYLCIDLVSGDDEWQTRQEAMFLHDNNTRRKMFRDLDPHYPGLIGFDSHHADLVKRLKARPYFQSLPVSTQKKFLSGNGFPFTQDELLNRMGLDAGKFRFSYRFMSAHTHTDPVAFYRMGEHGRGAGVENRVEKIYFANALDLAGVFLVRATDEIFVYFPDAEVRGSQLNGNRSQRRSQLSKR